MQGTQNSQKNTEKEQMDDSQFLISKLTINSNTKACGIRINIYRCWRIPSLEIDRYLHGQLNVMAMTSIPGQVNGEGTVFSKNGAGTSGLPRTTE